MDRELASKYGLYYHSTYWHVSAGVAPDYPSGSDSVTGPILWPHSDRNLSEGNVSKTQQVARANQDRALTVVQPRRGHKAIKIIIR